MNPRHPIAALTAFLTAAAHFSSPAGAQQTERVSVDSNGVQGNRDCTLSSISADGRLVAFESLASTLVFGDTNLAADVFVHDRQTGRTIRVSVDSAGVQAEFGGHSPCISPDGRFVAFLSASTNLVVGDANGAVDVFVHDCVTGETTRASVDSAGVEGNRICAGAPSISTDGDLVAFSSYATNLVPGDTNGSYDIFVHDRQTGQTSRVSVASAGGQGNSSSYLPAISADGQTIAFQSYASNLAINDTNGVSDIFSHDRRTGVTTRVSVNSAGVQGNDASSHASISADGKLVAFGSRAANLVPGDTNGCVDAFVRDLNQGLTIRASQDPAGAQSNGPIQRPVLSADGRSIAFAGLASNLVPGDTNQEADVFVKDLQSGEVRRVSVDSAGVQSNKESALPSLSSDGRLVAFSSAGPRLVSYDTNDANDVFVHDLDFTGPRLTLAGACPGPITLTIHHASANGVIALACGQAGSYVKITRPCQGTVLGVHHPFVGATHLRADAAGSAVIHLHLPTGVCGFTVQALDFATCRPTNVIVL